jgi:DNA modification methylase
MYKIEELKNTIHCADCLTFMKGIPDKSIDMILCDLPYQITACSWDTIIPFEPLWKEYKRIIKDNGAIVLTASQPFTSALVMSNVNNFSHQWVWVKEQGANPLLANKQPMKNFEDVLVFYNNYDEVFADKRRIYFKQILDFIGKKKSQIIKETNQGIDHCFRFNSLQFDVPTKENYQLLIDLYKINEIDGFLEYNLISDIKRVYNPQMTDGKRYKSGKSGVMQHLGGMQTDGGKVSNKRYPKSTIYFTTDKTKSLHPTQKPVALGQYLIKTYTNKGDLVLDNCCGSGSFLVAAKLENRNFIGIEISEKYCEIARGRLRQELLL